MTRSNIVVAGGGLAGAAAAIGLAQSGHKVTLFERETGPVHKICGEFLSIEAQDYLARLGLDLSPLAGAPIARLRLVRGARAVSTDLPFRAVGVSRCKLDEALLLHAGACGVEVRRGHPVRRVDAGPYIRLEVEGIGRVEPDILLLATGKHEVRGIKRDFTTRKNMIGFKMYFRLRPSPHALDNHIELVFFPGGYAGLQLIEDNVANLCLIVDRDRYRHCGGSWESLLAYLKAGSSVLADQLAGAEPLLAQPLAIYQVPYGFIHKPGAGDAGNLFRLGDQACVIQSFTGDGMSIALHSAARAVQMITRGANANAYHRRLAQDIRGQIRRAEMLSTLMNNPLTQSGLFGMSRLWPRGLKIAAQLTRVSTAGRVEAGFL